MTSKVAIHDVGHTLLWSNLDKPWHLQCSENNSLPKPIPAFCYTAINRSLLFNCQLQGGSVFYMNL